MLNKGALANASFTLENLRPVTNVLGIDLGTTNTVAAVWLKGKNCPEIITAESNERILPSYVWFKEDGTCDIGKNAVRSLKQYPANVCYDAKRMIGQSFTTSTEVQSGYWSFQIANQNGRPVYKLSDDRMVEPEQVSTEVLKKAKQLAEGFVGAKIDVAVITVPAYFGQHQRQATIDAATAAGIQVLQLETEPTAAAYAFNYDHKRYDDYNLFVFDLGGGTFDITIISINDGKFNVGATGGDSTLGGRDFDNLLMEFLTQELKKMGAPNLKETKSVIKLRQLAESIKISLSTCSEETVNLDDFNPNQSNTSIKITRKDFERLTNLLKIRLKDACEKTLSKAKFSSEDIHNVLLIGGASRMPLVIDLLNDLFPQSSDTLYYQSRGLNPDEAVAYGAAIRAAQLTDPSHRDFAYITNVLPIGIGIGLVEDQYSLMVKCGTKYPTRIKKRYFTTENNQKEANINVFEGERVEASQNQQVFLLTVRDLPPGLAGDVYVDVTFELDNNGILKVMAKSKTGYVEGVINYRQITQSGKPIDHLFQELNLNVKNEAHKKVVIEARAQLRKNMEVIRGRYQNIANAPTNKKRKIIEECEYIIQWLDDNPGQTVDDDIIVQAKAVERDAEELIHLRLMTL